MGRVLYRYRWFLLIVVIGLAVDLVTKAVVFERIGVTDDVIHDAVARGWERYRQQEAAVAEWETEVRAAQQDGEAEPAVPPPSAPMLHFSLPAGHRYEIVPRHLYFSAVLNPGAFGGLLGGHVAVLLGLSLLAVLIVAWILVRSPLRRYQVVSGLIIAGALGNMYDRLVYGAVRDFVDFRLPDSGISWLNPWNTFNFADASIVGGILALLVLEFFFPPKPATQPTHTDAATSASDDAEAVAAEAAPTAETPAEPAGNGEREQ